MTWSQICFRSLSRWLGCLTIDEKIHNAQGNRFRTLARRLRFLTICVLMNLSELKESPYPTEVNGGGLLLKCTHGRLLRKSGFRTLQRWLGCLTLEVTRYVLTKLFPSPLEVTGGAYQVLKKTKLHLLQGFRPLSRWKWGAYWKSNIHSSWKPNVSVPSRGDWGF